MQGVKTIIFSEEAGEEEISGAERSKLEHSTVHLSKRFLIKLTTTGQNKSWEPFAQKSKSGIVKSSTLGFDLAVGSTYKKFNSRT